MKYARSLLLLATILTISRFLFEFSAWAIVIVITALLPVLLYQFQRTQIAAYARIIYGLISLLLLVLVRHDLVIPDSKPNIVFNPKTQATEISADFMEQVRKEQQALLDSDPEKWRQELRDRAEKLRR